MAITLVPSSKVDKFQRTYFLELQGNDGLTYSVGSENGFAPYLTLEFSVNRGVLAAVNNGSFRIFNLPSDVRGQVYHDFYTPVNMKRMKLKAGYVGTPLSTVFNGQAFTATSYRPEGSTEWVTEIEGQDFSSPLSASYSQVSLSAPGTSSYVSQSQVIAKLANDLISTGNSLNAPLQVGYISPNYLSNHYKRFNTFGNTWELLQTETQKTCYIDSGLIYCLPNSESFVGPITLISSETGLLGVPKLYQTYLEAEMLFEPGIIPGQSIYLDTTSLSKFNSKLNGLYKVTGVQHSGIISMSMGGKCKTLVTLQTTAQQRINALSIKIPSL